MVLSFSIRKECSATGMKCSPWVQWRRWYRHRSLLASPGRGSLARRHGPVRETPPPPPCWHTQRGTPGLRHSRTRCPSGCPLLTWNSQQPRRRVWDGVLVHIGKRCEQRRVDLDVRPATFCPTVDVVPGKCIARRRGCEQ